MPHVFNPKITAAGEAAAIAASNAGLELALTHIGFSTAVFDPTGAETSLASEVVRLPISAGARITPTQVRVSATWNADAGTKNINAVGFYAGSTLFAVWSSTAVGATPLAVKTDGIPFVLYYDFAITSLPPGSITVLADTGQSLTLLALNNHLADGNAHPQYQRIDGLANAEDSVWCGTAGGTDNAITLPLPTGQLIPAHKAGLSFRFKAAHTNTGTVTVTIGALAAKAVTKSGSTALAPTDIVAGAVYELVYDGTNYQITGSAGSTANAFQRFQFTGAGPHTCSYTPGSVEVFRNGSQLSTGDFTASNGTTVTIPSAGSTDEIVIIAFGTFAVADAYTKSEIDTMLAAVAINPEGKCRLGLSGGSLLLYRYRGITLPIGGIMRSVPGGGVTLSSAGLSASTTYYIYAAWVAGAMALEASAVAYTTDATTGLMVKSTDASRTLVGIARTDGGAAWQLCRSWFNDMGYVGRNWFTAERSSANATTFTEINSEIRVPFLLWAGENPRISAHGTIRIDTYNQEFHSSIAVDGTVLDVFTMMDSYATYSNMPLSMTVSPASLAEGYHYATIVGRSTANTYSGHYAGGGTTAQRTTLEVAITPN